MFSLNEINNEYISKNKLFSLNEYKINEKNTSVIKKSENIKKSILKSSSSNKSSINTKKTSSLPELDNDNILKIRAFEILSKLRHIKGLEKIEEKKFLDITLNISKDINSKNKKKTNNASTKVKNIKKGTAKLPNKENMNDKENINNSNLNANNGINNNSKTKEEESETNNSKIISDIENDDENNLLLSPILMEFILHLFSTLFWKLNIKSFQSLKEDRKNEKVFNNLNYIINSYNKIF